MSRDLEHVRIGFDCACGVKFRAHSDQWVRSALRGNLGKSWKCGELKGKKDAVIVGCGKPVVMCEVAANGTLINPGGFGLKPGDRFVGNGFELEFIEIKGGGEHFKVLRDRNPLLVGGASNYARGTAEFRVGEGSWKRLAVKAETTGWPKPNTAFGYLPNPVPSEVTHIRTELQFSRAVMHMPLSVRVAESVAKNGDDEIKAFRARQRRR